MPVEKIGNAIVFTHRYGRYRSSDGVIFYRYVSELVELSTDNEKLSTLIKTLSVFEHSHKNSRVYFRDEYDSVYNYLCLEGWEQVVNVSGSLVTAYERAAERLVFNEAKAAAKEAGTKTINTDRVKAALVKKENEEKAEYERLRKKYETS